MPLTVLDGALVPLDPNDSRVLSMDWDTDNLADGTIISTSTFFVRAHKPAGIAITSITRSTTTATVTTAAAHGLATGDYVAISGAVQTAYNITAAITVTSTTTFTYTMADSGASPATGTIVYQTGLHKDNEDILDDVTHDSRYTQLRLVAQGDSHVGKVFEITNRIVTNESPTQTKERSFFVVIQNMSLM